MLTLGKDLQRAMTYPTGPLPQKDWLAVALTFMRPELSTLALWLNMFYQEVSDDKLVNLNSGNGERLTCKTERDMTLL